MQKFTGAAAQEEAQRLLAFSHKAIASALAPFEPRSTFKAWFSTYRGIEELINLPVELAGEPLLYQVLGLDLLDMQGFAQEMVSIKASLDSRLSRLVVMRLLKTLVQLHAISRSFAMHGVPCASELVTVGSAIDYLQSRRRHILALLYTIPKTCHGSRRLHEVDGFNQFLYLIETACRGTTTMHYNLMLSMVYPDFSLEVDNAGASASHGFNALDSLFLEPERTAITEMAGVDLAEFKNVPVNRRLIFSKAELENNLGLIAAAYAEFNLDQTTYGQLAAFFRSLLPMVVDEYYVQLTTGRFDELCSKHGLPDHLKKALVVDSGDYVESTSTYAPFNRVGGELVTSITLLSRFANHWKNSCLNRVRRYQIRSGFIFEHSVKEALRRQGFTVTDIKRVGHAEFDVVATLDGVIYNIQCKNNLVDLNRIEADVKKFVRYNRRLDRAYQRALDKEGTREKVLLGELGLSDIKHFVVSRFPVATQNAAVLPFGEISRFKAIAVDA
ncbi:restriction endonuclease [Stenotrophomonas sp. PD6]|uniref:restriction endonuclease n=1 Tax=Stenotrophomonas sp. PD6 TaxID=3368612 RepID=UPI003B9FA9E1